MPVKFTMTTSCDGDDSEFIWSVRSGSIYVHESGEGLYLFDLKDIPEVISGLQAVYDQNKPSKPAAKKSK